MESIKLEGKIEEYDAKKLGQINKKLENDEYEFGQNMQLYVDPNTGIVDLEAFDYLINVENVEDFAEDLADAVSNGKILISIGINDYGYLVKNGKVYYGEYRFVPKTCFQKLQEEIESL